MAKLHIIKGPLKGKIFDLEGETVFIGRSSRNDIQIKDLTISRKQIKILWYVSVKFSHTAPWKKMIFCPLPPMETTMKRTTQRKIGAHGHPKT